MPKTVNYDDLSRNYYRLLGVDPTAPPAVVRAAYRAMMGEVGRHPDRGGGHEGAILLNRAKEILLDPELRAQYDRLRSRSDRPNQSAGAAPTAKPTQSHTGEKRTADQNASAGRSGTRKPFKADTRLRRCRVCGALAEPVRSGQERPPDVCKKCFWSDRLR